MCGPALTWGLYGVGRDSAGMGTMRVLPEGARSHLSGFARRPAWPEAARAGAYAGGSACVLAVLFWAAEAGARAASRPRGAALDVCAGGGAADSRALLSPGCCCVARSIVVDRGSQTTVPALARPSNSSQVYVSRFRRACLADRAPNNFFGRAKFKLVLLNASSACGPSAQSATSARSPAKPARSASL